MSIITTIMDCLKFSLNLSNPSEIIHTGSRLVKQRVMYEYIADDGPLPHSINTPVANINLNASISMAAFDSTLAASEDRLCAIFVTQSLFIGAIM